MILAVVVSFGFVGCVAPIQTYPQTYAYGAPIMYRSPSPVQVQLQPDCTPVYREPVCIPYYAPVYRPYYAPRFYYPYSSISFRYSRSHVGVGVNITN